MVTKINISNKTISRSSLGESRAAYKMTMVARMVTVGLAMASLGWVCFAGPILWSQAPMLQLAQKILGGEQYRPGFLADFADRGRTNLRQGICEPVARRTLAIVSLRLAEQAIAGGDEASIARTEADLDAALVGALACAPTDGFSWLALFWLQNNTRGLQQDNFRALRLSYRYAPNEGWLALRRSRFALAVYPALPDDLKRQAIDEFVQLVKSDFVVEAADIIAGPGRPIADRLLARLDGVDFVKLRQLAHLLEARDFEGHVPGIEPAPHPRPW